MAGILATLYVAFFLIERMVALRPVRAPLWSRLIVNFGQRRQSAAPHCASAGIAGPELPA